MHKTNVCLVTSGAHGRPRAGARAARVTHVRDRACGCDACTRIREDGQYAQIELFLLGEHPVYSSEDAPARNKSRKRKAKTASNRLKTGRNPEKGRTLTD